MKEISVFEKLNCVDRIVTTSLRYKSGSINVGDNLLYKEVDEFNIEIIDNIRGNVIIDVRYSYECDDSVDIVGDSNSLFPQFDDNENLKNNNKYSISLSIDGKDFSKTLYSKLWPYYSYVETIREDTGDILLDIEDITIHKTIYKNSREVLRFFKADGLENDSDIENSIIEAYNTIPYELVQYVRYKTDLDLLNSSYLTFVKNYGKTKKEISSLNIEYENKLPILKDMLGYFKDKVDELEDDILGLNDSTNISVSFVKASKKAKYPIDKRNSF